MSVERSCALCRQSKPVTEFTRRTGKSTYQSRCKLCAARVVREARKSNPERRALVERQSKLRRVYGMTPERYDELLKSQDGKCALCGRTEVTRRLSIDHDHKTGVVRGLLCPPCNRALGTLGDGEGTIERLRKYLKE